jgi:SseB protein N-terminal domain
MSAPGLDFQLEAPNQQLREAIDAVVKEPSDTNRRRLCGLMALSKLILAIRGDVQVNTPGAIAHFLGTQDINGRSILHTFTDIPALRDRSPEAHACVISLPKLLEHLDTNGHAGLILNAAGPWVIFSRDEIASALKSNSD